MVKHCLIDIDGVLADFTKDALRVHGKDSHEVTKWDFFEDWGISANEFWKAIDAEEHQFWQSLSPYPWMKELIEIVADYCNFTLATTPSLSHHCCAGKRLWIQQHFGKNFTKYMIGGEKHLMAKPGVVLIDDSEKNIDLFASHGGFAILFPQPWNRNRGIDPIRHVYESLEALDNLD